MICDFEECGHPLLKSQNFCPKCGTMNPRNEETAIDWIEKRHAASDTDAQLTSWAREWWPLAEVFIVRDKEGRAAQKWVLRNGPDNQEIGLGDGGRLDARLALHAIVNAHLNRGTIGPDTR